MLPHAGQAILGECSKVLGKQNDFNRKSLARNFLAAAIDLQASMGRNVQLHFSISSSSKGCSSSVSDLHSTLDECSRHSHKRIEVCAGCN